MGVACKLDVLAVFPVQSLAGQDAVPCAASVELDRAFRCPVGTLLVDDSAVLGSFEVHKAADGNRPRAFDGKPELEVVSLVAVGYIDFGILKHSQITPGGVGEHYIHAGSFLSSNTVRSKPNVLFQEIADSPAGTGSKM